MGVSTGTEWNFTTGATFADTVGYTLNFDGADDFVDCGNHPALRVTGNTITIEALIQAEDWRPNYWDGVIVAKDYSGGATTNYGYMLRAGNNGMLSFNIGSGSWNELNTGTGLMESGTWHHVAGTYDGSMMRLYLDGELVGESARNITVGNASSVSLFIGESPSFRGRVFDGLIDEVRVWDIARTQEEIQANLDAELSEQYYSEPGNGLVGYWQLNEGEGQTVANLATEESTGVLGSTMGEDSNDPAWVSIIGVVYPTPVGDSSSLVPAHHELQQNYPNPFNPSTTIQYNLPSAAFVTVKVYDTRGREIRTLVNESQIAGFKAVLWDGKDDSGRSAGSGVYLYRVKAGDWVERRKMVLLK